MGKAEEKFVYIANILINKLKDDDNSEKSVALLEMLIKRVSTNDLSRVVEVIEDFDTISCFLEIDDFTYSEKCRLTSKIINSNYKVLEHSNVIDLNSEDLIKIFREYGYTKIKEISKVVESFDSGDTKSISKELVTKIIKETLSKEKNTHVNEVRFLYSKLSDFATKDIRTEKDYIEAKEILEKLGVGGIYEKNNHLIEYYLTYYKNIDKKYCKHIISQPMKKEVKSNSICRGEVKKALNNYCNLNKDKPFDYANYDEVLNLLSMLQLADNVNEKYFNYCYQNRIENKDYYKYLLLKIRDNFKYQETVNLITWYKENIESEEDKIAAYQEIYEILKSVPDIEMLNFDYEMTRVRKK